MTHDGSSSDHPDPGPAEEFQAQIDLFLRVLLTCAVLGLGLETVRLVQLGPNPFLITQMVGTALIVLVLSLRRFMADSVLMVLLHVLVVGICMMGVMRFGLLSPNGIFLVTIPTVTTLIWGWRYGVQAAVLVAIGPILMTLMFWNGRLEPTLPPADYMRDPLNWLLWLGVAGLAAGLTMKVADLQRRFWLRSLRELQQQSELRQRSEVQLDRAEAWWQSMDEHMPGVMFDYIRAPDGSRRIGRMGEVDLETWGVTADEVQDNIAVLAEIISPATLREVRDLVDRSEQSREAWSCRIPTRARDGQERWFHLTGKPQDMEDGGTLWHCLGLDITAEVRAQSEARRQFELASAAQRQESIGQLSGGVAHDFNNLLAVILGNLELLQEEVKDPDQQDLIRNSIDATRRGADLTRNMLAFARQATLDPAELDLNAVVRDAQNWIGRTIPSNISVETILAPGLDRVEADEGSTVSALLNLIVNARDAMPEGGTITVETANLHLTDPVPDVSGRPLEPGDYVCVRVSDTGAGIGPEQRDRVFQPFYTTKAPGAGSGLGLPMVEGFMRQSGGAVLLETAPGEGARFDLCFPALRGAAKPAPRKRPDTAQPTEGARILVVEDEPGVLKNLRATLGRSGYVVQTAETGDAALEMFRIDAGIDLLLTDIVMPGRLQGTGLARELRQLAPDLPVVFMSGYAGDTPQDKATQMRPDDIRLTKPVRRSELVAAIEAALGRASEGG